MPFSPPYFVSWRRWLRGLEVPWPVRSVAAGAASGAARFTGFFNFDVFLANLFLHFLSIGLGGFARANFFTKARLFLDNHFFATQWNINFLFIKRLLSTAVSLVGRDALDHQFFALNFDGLINNFGADDFSQAHAADFDLAFANL